MRNMLKTLYFLTLSLAVSVSLWSMPLGASEDTPKNSETQPSYSQFFSEKILKVTTESDGILPGSLRTVLIQANGIRANASFVLVKIVLDPKIKKIRITKGPLPAIEGSLTTLDCQTPQGTALIEGDIQDTAGLDPSTPLAGLTLSSHGNTIRNCHITGFPGSGILIEGNRNEITDNILGYQQEGPTLTTPTNPSDLKTNQGAGIFLGKGANANIIHNNEITTNVYHGIHLSDQVGADNSIYQNIFSKNSGKPISIIANNYSTGVPTHRVVSQEGEWFLIKGHASMGSKVIAYLLGQDVSEVGLFVGAATTNNQGTFSIRTKSKGFVPGKTQLVLTAKKSGYNTSEFSQAVLIPVEIRSVDPVPATESSPDQNVTAPATSHPMMKPAPTEATGHKSDALGNEEDLEKTNAPTTPTHEPVEVPSPNTPNDGNPEEAETSFNIQGMGEKGHEPDTGNLGRPVNVSSFGS